MGDGANHSAGTDFFANIGKSAKINVKLPNVDTQDQTFNLRSVPLRNGVVAAVKGGKGKLTESQPDPTTGTTDYDRHNG